MPPTCRYCAASLAPPKKTWCNERCRDKWRYHNDAERREDTMRRCREWFAARRPGDWKPKERKWPSSPVAIKDCPQCATVFVSRQGRKFCTNRCTLEYDKARKRTRYTAVHRTARTCVECGTEFSACITIPQTFCSQRCSRRYRKRARKHRMRATRTSGEWISIRIVGNRDGWRCHICRRKVKRSEASLDHLNPLSDKENGTHELVNVALAHIACNGRRSNGLLPAQLRLIA